MGKILDILRGPSGPGPRPGHEQALPESKGPERLPAPLLPLPARESPAEAIIEMKPPADASDEEFPFIEVGGPNKRLDASPVVLAATPLPRPRLVLANAEPPKVPAPAVRMTAVRPLSVSFEPWPGQAAGGRQIAPEIIAFHQPDHPASKQYADLFEQVAVGLEKSPVLTFIGAAAKSGTTTVLLNLAFTACRQSRRVALVEGNMKGSALAERLGLTTAPGWHELLAGQVGLEQALSQTAAAELSVLTAGARHQEKETVSPEALRWVLGWLRERYDLVLIDGPELDHASALPVLLAAADGAYLVLPQSESQSSRLGVMTQCVIRSGGRLRGLIHTQFESL